MAFAVDLTGSILDRRYRITGLLGRGGMGYVYDAVHVALDQRVALKVLHPRYAYEQRFRERFLQEARAASKIHHRNVVEIKDFGETPDDSVYFVMEYLDGHDVGDELKQHGVLPWSRTRGILLQAASALHAAHLEQIIHRDIKPGNCFLTKIRDGNRDGDDESDRVKLLDFGIAKVGSDQHADAQGKGLTGTGEVFGTASYMAPEQARGEVLDARSDMYSLGIMAYEMLTGEVPFSGINAIHVITRHLNDPPEPPRSINPEVPAAVEAVVLRMIAKDRGDRFASMAALERALRAIPKDAGEKGKRRTRLWSSPGDLRALVAEKKAAAGKVPAPGVASGDGGTGTDAERTQLVAPAKAGPAAGGVKKTLVPGVAKRTVPEGPMGWAPPRPPAVAPPSAALPPIPPPVVAPASAVATPPPPPVTVPASSAAPPAPVGASDPVGFLGSAEASAPPSAAFIPSGADGTNPSPGRGIDGTNPPPGRGIDGTNPPPGRGVDGTNPPPGRGADGTNPSGPMVWPTPSWQSSNAGTGPLERVGETGSELSPQGLEAGEGQGISTRMLWVVGVLVLLVGVASAGGTLAFLSNQAGAKEPQGQVVPTAKQNEAEPEDGRGAPAEPEVADDGLVELRVPLADVGTSAAESVVAVPGVDEVILEGGGEGEGELAEATVDEPTPDAVDAGELTEPSPGAPDADEAPSEAPAPGPKLDQPEEPSVPAHETEKCVKVRDDASTALGQRKWKDLARLTGRRQKKCWPSGEQAARTSMLVMALLEDERFEDCVKAGQSVKDPTTARMVNTCRSKVP